MTVIDIPPGWTALLVAIVGGVVGFLVALEARRTSRMNRLERENRKLWFGLRLAVDAMFRGGITPPDTLLELINDKDEP